MSISSEHEIARAYRDPNVSAQYVERRFTSELTRLLHDRQVTAINRLVRRTGSRRLLEVAPGPGRLTRDVTASDLTCLESNEGMIEEGKRHCSPNVRWIQGNAFELPFHCEFDLLYTFRFVRHFHQEDRSRLYRQFRNVLNPGGSLMFDAVNDSVSAPLRCAQRDAYSIYDKLYASRRDLEDELADADFEVVKVEPVQRWFAMQYKAQVLLGPRSRLFCRLAIRTLERLRRGPALEWIVTCRRA